MTTKAVEAYPPKLCSDCGSSLDQDTSQDECRHCRKCLDWSCSHSAERGRRIAEEYANIAKALATLEALEGSRPWGFHQEELRPGLVGHSGFIARDPEGFWYAEMDEKE